MQEERNYVFDYRNLIPGSGGGGGGNSNGMSSSFLSGGMMGSSNLNVGSGGGNFQSMNEGIGTGGSGDEDDDCCSFCPEMTWRERLLGCATCMVAGYLLSFGSFLRIKDLMLGDPKPFVLNATAGNIIALAGSCFLSGPRTQYSRMWHDSRRLATILYLGSLILTMVIAFSTWIPLRGILLIFLMVFQYLAITWYCLSYIPFAREAITSYVQRRWNTASDASEGLM